MRESSKLEEQKGYIRARLEEVRYDLKGYTPSDTAALYLEGQIDAYQQILTFLEEEA